MATTTEPTETLHPGTCVLVRLGLHGQVGRLETAAPMSARRGLRVLCRSARGLEIGESLGAPAASDTTAGDGRVLRPMRPEDELLWGHLKTLGNQTQQACQQWLDDNDIPAVLLDVEPLMDGKTLYFHFLDDIDESVSDHVADLAQLYEQQVQSSEFSQLLEIGCGPGCGTENAKNGCSSRGGCAVCKIADACKTRK